MRTNTKHLESLYLVLTDTGSLVIQSYRPTDPYSGQKASDLPALGKISIS